MPPPATGEKTKQSNCECTQETQVNQMIFLFTVTISMPHKAVGTNFCNKVRNSFHIISLNSMHALACRELHEHSVSIMYILARISVPPRFVANIQCFVLNHV